jgi:hypothetical protein
MLYVDDVLIRAAKRVGPPQSLNSNIKPKRKKLTAAEVDTLRESLHAIIAEDRPMTVRQVFYRAVAAYLIEKTEKAYQQICYYLSLMRREGELPFEWIADNTRTVRRPYTVSSLDEVLDSTAEEYRRAVWDNQDVYVQVWAEKDAISGVIEPVTQKWDVPLMVTRGFSSLSFLYEAAELISEQDKPTFCYYFGDHDPSGVAIDPKIEEELNDLAPDAEIHFQRVAVLPHQIKEMKLPTRPTKRTDRRAVNFEGDSVEVDAIPPGTLREMVESCIKQHIDVKAYEELLGEEGREKEILGKMAKRHRGKRKTL